MNEYIKKISNKPDFEQENYFKGYYLSRGNLGIEVDYIDMVSGHQFFQKETKSIHIYYIIEGRGIAYIDENRFEIEQGDTIEIPVFIGQVMEKFFGFHKCMLSQIIEKKACFSD